jgi:hypothetical protein
MHELRDLPITASQLQCLVVLLAKHRTCESTYATTRLSLYGILLCIQLGKRVCVLWPHGRIKPWVSLDARDVDALLLVQLKHTVQQGHRLAKRAEPGLKALNPYESACSEHLIMRDQDTGLQSELCASNTRLSNQGAPIRAPQARGTAAAPLAESSGSMSSCSVAPTPVRQG